MSATLEVLFSSAARVQVLRLFLLHRGQKFYQREIERETGQPIRAVQREVERMEGIGLLLRSTEGNRVFYRLNPTFHLLDALTALFREGGEPEASEPATSEAAPPSMPGPRAEARQPFPWLDSTPSPPLPASLRRRQVEGDWDQGY